MSLIEDIQASAISEAGDVSALLRKCKLLAARLDNREFASWVDRELSGYPEGAALPSYRVVGVRSYGHFVGPFGMKANGLQIPVSVLPEQLKESYRTARLDQAISTYQNLLGGDSGGSARIAWPTELAIHCASKLTPNMQCVEAWIEIPLGAIHRLVSEVKTAILGFAIDIQREAPNAGDSPVGGPKLISEERVTQIFNTNIAGNVGNVANANTTVEQSATVVGQAGDWTSLKTYLESLGISNTETIALKEDLDAHVGQDPATLKTKLGTWVGGLVGKVMSSGAGVAVDAAASGIAKAIASYLGIPLS
ncbi:hypothetical protein [Pandoraea sp. NPDC087047]|uniref:AbiTii domain-containing protein n=1 Tax=Pandoraea sp. NPDC087047 TaxID=3364390 RepID=UPI00380CD5C7